MIGAMGGPQPSPESESPADDEAIAGATAAHQALFRTVTGLTDDQARSACLLPGWTVGHLLTHIARNADSHTRMLSAALDGEVAEQYAGGTERRASDIASGSDRSAAELVADVERSAAALEAVWARMTPQAWAGHGRNADGRSWPCVAMPFHRWREVEVHHADLGLGYTPADWPDDYVRRELATGLRLLPDRLDDAGRRAALAWLLGRAESPGELALTPWQSRPDDYLR
jgi:maleylpyruvate isomerase